MIVSRFYEDLSVLHDNTLPARAYYIPASEKMNNLIEHREESDRLQLLNGNWKFKYFNSIYDLTDNFYEMGYDTAAFDSIKVPGVWQMSGYMMIVYIAQIQQIPESVKEAARIDGANSWQLMRYIILPLMMPAFTIGLFLSISSSFKMFDQNLALTQGGPYKSTEMIALNIYNSAFGANEFGFAQAKAIVFLIIVAGIGVTQLVITKRKEVEM